MTTFDLGIRLSTVRRLFVPLVSLIEKHSGYASDDSEIGAALTCRQSGRKCSGGVAESMLASFVGISIHPGFAGLAERSKYPTAQRLPCDNLQPCEWSA